MAPKTGSEIRKSFIDFFIEKGHTFVPSAPLVPGGDQTLLFTNSGMVQFKDVFLGTDKREYVRAVNSQKCMRVAGKHNDLDDVGRDDYHHTFFEMLGNWSFGDYFKKEAIEWAWELLTERWGLDRSKLWVTCFKDEKDEIPIDEEAAQIWRDQPGILPGHILFFGRKENFWEMAETGPCGLSSEIHIDTGIEFCDKQGEKDHVCQVNGNCKRFLELWNLVFIQYNRLDANHLEPLPSRHVDTGMGFERIVSIIEKTGSNYKTDLMMPLINTVQSMTGQSDLDRDANFTPYRVIADHARSATFLIADGVVPGNIGRNYVCRMIIRRAARYGSKLGLNEPFLSQIAEIVIQKYCDAYPELLKNRKTILENITREEQRFSRTVEAGIAHLEDLLNEVRDSSGKVLDGQKAFDLYATHGLPLEITRDIAREVGLEVDEMAFQMAMDEHRVQSGSGKVFGSMGGADAETFRKILEGLVNKKVLPSSGVVYDPYSRLEIQGKLLSLIVNGESSTSASIGDHVEVIVPDTCFYIEAGGQVSDTGWIKAQDGNWEIRVDDVRRPAAGIIVHIGEVVKGSPQVNDLTLLKVDVKRRQDIMRNHSATHLLHAELHKVLGEHARQAGSLVAPDHLRFDFTHPTAVTSKQLELIENGVNQAILEGYNLNTVQKPLSEALSEGAMALFGEKYGENVRAVSIGTEDRISYELCGGTHVSETSEIGFFIITSESSAAAGVRRIEAVTGRKAYELVKHRLSLVRTSANLLNSPIDQIPERISMLIDTLDRSQKMNAELQEQIVVTEFRKKLSNIKIINNIQVLTESITNSDADLLRRMVDLFYKEYPSGLIVLGSIIGGKPLLVAAVSDDLVKKGYHAGELLKKISLNIGGSGGGRPNMAQAGGKNPEGLNLALDEVYKVIQER